MTITYKDLAQMLEVAVRLKNELIEMDSEAAIELDKWPTATEFITKIKELEGE